MDVSPGAAAHHGLDLAHAGSSTQDESSYSTGSAASPKAASATRKPPCTPAGSRALRWSRAAMPAARPCRRRGASSTRRPPLGPLERHLQRGGTLPGSARIETAPRRAGGPPRGRDREPGPHGEAPAAEPQLQVLLGRRGDAGGEEPHTPSQSLWYRAPWTKPRHGAGGGDRGGTARRTVEGSAPQRPRRGAPER